MSLLDAMGVDPQSFTWHSLALCNGSEDPDLFFDKYESDETTARQIDEMCLHCPVLKQCLETGIDDKQTGVWGAIYLTNGVTDKNKNTHKTEDTWKRIRERVTE